MKTKNLLFIAAFCWAGFLAAQHQTLLGRSPLNGAFGAPMYEYGIEDGILGAVGGGGGLVFRNFFVGAYGVGSSDAFDELINNGDINNMSLAHGGIWLGYTPGSYNVFHPYFSARGGWGVIDIDFDDPNQVFNDLDQVFVLTPEAGIELNVTRWFRINGTVGYRVITGVNDANPPSVTDNLQGLVGGVTLRFGWFGNNRKWRNREWYSD